MQKEKSWLNSRMRQQSVKNYLALSHLLYLCGLFILFSKVKSRCTPPATFTLEDYYTRTNDGASNSSDRKESRIPRIIHQSYKSLESLPTVWKETPSRWKKLHPEYEYKFWSDEDNRHLIETYYPWFLSTFDNYPAPIQRADAARYFAVLHFGGIYADMDILPIRDVSPLLDRLDLAGSEDAEMLVAETYNLGLTNALFAAVPNSTVLEKFVRDLPLHTKPLYGFESLNPHFGVLLSTGPTRMWIFFNNYRDKILTLSPAGWGQCHQCKQKHCKPQEGSFFETTKGGSWHKWDTIFMNFIFCHVHFVIWSSICILMYLYRKFYTHRYTLLSTELPSVGNNLTLDQRSSSYEDVSGKRKTWNTKSIMALSFENATVLLSQLLLKQRFPLFCAIVLMFVY